MDKKTLASLSKFILGIILIGSVLVLSGCDSIIKEIGEAFSRPSEREKVEIVLTERQKQILYDSGLSTDYDSLLQSQKSAIIAIEEMLQAVEKKYGMEFAYSGYTDATPLENETLWAYPKGGDPSTDSFSVQRSEKNGKTEYFDNYIMVALVPMYSSYIAKFPKEQLGEKNVKVVSEITYTNLQSMPKDMEELENSVEGGSSILIDGEFVSEEDFHAFRENYLKWLEEHGLYGEYQIALLKGGYLKYVNKYNYTRYTTDEYSHYSEFHYVKRQNR